MNSGVGPARIGQWYASADKGEIFHVVGFDEDSQTIGIQTFDGDLDEIDRDAWSALPLALAAPPEDWTGPVDDVERDDLGYSETDMTGADWSEPLRQLRAEGEEPGSRGRTMAQEDESETGDMLLDARVPEGRVVPARPR
jgi:hypothetical protein